MTEAKPTRRISRIHLLSATLVALGVGLWMVIGKEFLFVAAIGAFGPGLAREFGWLRDHDEFQRAAAHRAGYHAYLAGGVSTAIVVSVLHGTGATIAWPAELLTWVLVVMWLTWLFSSTLHFWSAPTMTRAVLGAFGGFWGLFIVVDLASGGASGTDLLRGLGTGLAVLLPFVVLGATASRWPRLSGLLLLLAGLVMTGVFFRPGGPVSFATQLFTLTILVAPLIACGIALVQRDAR